VSDERLLELQRADDRQAALRGELAAVEARLRADPELDRARAAATAARDEQRRAEAAVAAADLEAGSLRDRGKQIDRQLYGGTVRNPQDLLILQRELEEVRARLAAAEDDELTRMQAAEEAEQARRDAEAAVVAREEHRAARAGPDAELVTRLTADVQDAESNRQRIRTELSPSDLAIYDRISTRRHPAVVHLIGDACGGCRIPLGISEVRTARSSDRLVQCPNCDRIIVR
jgi:predicted  nucleic acid-binding Zn-ribbon protein